MRLIGTFAAVILTALLSTSAGNVLAAGGSFLDRSFEAAVPDQAIAARLLNSNAPLRLRRQETPLPDWSVEASGKPIGYLASTWEISRSVGYSGRPIDILVAVTPDGRIAGAELIRHNEPILTLGISTADIARYVDGFAGVDLTELHHGSDTESVLPDVIARATVSTGVIRDAILRTVRSVILGRRLQSSGATGIDRQSFAPITWAGLTAEKAVAGTEVTLDQAREALAGASTPIPSGGGAFIDLRVAVLDPPTIGRNLLGQQGYTRAMAALGPDEVALFVASKGLQSHRGTAWRRSGVFDRIALRQGNETYFFRAEDYRRIDKLALPEAPDFKEMSLFRLSTEVFDPTAPFTLEVTAERETATGSISMVTSLPYLLPPGFRQQAADLPEAAPLWISAWQRKRAEIAGVGLMLAVLAGILFFQESFVRRAHLWRWGRIAFLTVTLVWLGWIAGGQLSVVHVVAFLHSLLSGFRWETFLIEPVVFILWGFVALGLLFWGRGVYCGWLCPFGALQELTNEIAQRLRIAQIEVPFVIQERLWVIKYTLFVAILGLSFYSMEQALILAEAEPFKTAMSMYFLRAWPFVVFVALILIAGLFIERFYCRYLCPLGAALAIPAKLKLFDWLRRRPQCGRECRLCEQQCTVGAIDPIGRINPNECVLCLRCQMIFHDDATCPVLKRRSSRRKQATEAPTPG
ncbi:4Fe-4S binding protein [Pelagibius sp.]|uniref:4Fe-4S binding protein n=1 Tax=Pelagibius sp. TaxID=1931238 RepID=UPI003BAF29C2